jgi:hypothetical protein
MLPLDSRSAMGDVVVLGSNNTVAQTVLGSFSIVGSGNYLACSILASGTFSDPSLSPDHVLL